MKKLTKLLSLALAILMVMSLAGAAFADGGVGSDTPAQVHETTITIKDSTPGVNFAYYRLFDATSSGTGTSAKYSYTPSAEYRQAMINNLTFPASVTTPTDQDIIDAVGRLVPGSTLDTFAKDLYEEIKEINTTDTTLHGNVTVAAEKTDVSFTVPSGYYLIAQTNLPEGSAHSSIIVDTGVGAAKEIKAKTSVPTSEKKEDEFNDSQGQANKDQDGADYDIGDEVPMVIYGSVVNNLHDYSDIDETTGTQNGHYYIIFHDLPEAGLSFVNDSTKYKAFINHQEGSSYGLVEIPQANYTVVEKTPENASTAEFASCGCAFHVKFDLFTLANGITNSDTDPNLVDKHTPHSNDKIRFEYKMLLNSEAVAGSAGNDNDFWMEYSNNPGVDSFGSTPKDKVTVFTYDLVVNKTDSAGKALEGAEFKLIKRMARATGVDDDNNVIYEYYDKDLGSVEPVVTGEGDAKKVTFTWHGLDAGRYKIEETKAPDGYTKAKPIYFRIQSTYDTTSQDPQFGSLSVTMLGENWRDNSSLDNPFNVDDETGKIEKTADNPNQQIITTVVNTSGAVLPSTGGIGTTLFYVFGSVLAIGAGVLLVSKKRMGAVD